MAMSIEMSMTITMVTIAMKVTVNIIWTTIKRARVCFSVSHLENGKGIFFPRVYRGDDGEYDAADDKLSIKDSKVVRKLRNGAGQGTSGPSRTG